MAEKKVPLRTGDRGTQDAAVRDKKSAKLRRRETRKVYCGFSNGAKLCFSVKKGQKKPLMGGKQWKTGAVVRYCKKWEFLSPHICHTVSQTANFFQENFSCARGGTL